MTHLSILLPFILALLIQIEALVPTSTCRRHPSSRRHLPLHGTTTTVGQPPSDDAEETPQESQPDAIRLQPFLPALDPNYRNIGPVGQADFIVSRQGEPHAHELTNENILKIVTDQQASDLEVNTLVWKGLGYRFVNGSWNNDKVFPKWRDKYPEPPDLIGMQRLYSKQVDEPCMRANQQLVRSIPADQKQQLRKHLKPMGFLGFKIAELTPNKTRRAQCANWLLYYRDNLFGYTLEELKAKRQREQQAVVASKGQGSEQSKEEDWRPPIKEVF